MPTIEPKHQAMWARASKLTKPATDPADQPSPRAVPRKPRVQPQQAEPVEGEAPAMVQAVR